MNECWDRSENIINRKAANFYIEVIPPKNFSSELEKMLGYSFDVKIYGLSMYDVFRTIPALLHGFWTSLVFTKVQKPALNMNFNENQ